MHRATLAEISPSGYISPARLSEILTLAKEYFYLKDAMVAVKGHLQAGDTQGAMRILDHNL